MRDSQELDDLDELKFSREQGFFDKSRGVSLAIAFLLVLSLFLALHFREVRVEVLEINTIAPEYVVAQVDFDFFDEEATIILKQEAVRDVGKIYRLTEKQISQSRSDFESAYIASGDWQKLGGEVDFEQLTKALDKIEKELQLARFTDPRTLQKIKQLHINGYHYVVYSPVLASDVVVFPENVWNTLFRGALNQTEISPQIEKMIETHYHGSQWLLEDDIPTQRLIRQKIQGQVPSKYTRVTAGNRIIDQGEPVTSRHIAMLQAMKQVLREQRNLWHPMTVSGSLILAVILATLFLVYFRINYPKILTSNRKLFLIIAIMIFTIAVAKITEYFVLNARNDFIEHIYYPVFVPFAAILLCSLMSASIASFISIFLSIVLMLSLSFEKQEGFLLINMATAYTAIFSMRGVHRRKEIFVVCGKVWLCAVAVLFSIHLYQHIDWTSGIAIHTFSSAVFLLLTAVAVAGLLPLLESTFRIMTDVTLMEYMDPNNELLRRLSIEAPGTYQHSVVVGNLAESAALAIGANGLFARVATLYHDIGKMATPQYFTENQQGGMNIHQLLTPQESAQVIIAHVSEGVSMARKAGLPEQFIDIIKEHHGTTLVEYFYLKQVEKMGDPELVDQREFRYAGPTPRSKEAAIIMIADSLEAASRSLEQLDEPSLMELANRLIRNKEEDGQFDQCLLTLEELADLKSTLVKTLVAYGHSRIKYPRRAHTPQNTVNLNG